MCSYATQSKRASLEKQQFPELSFAIIKESEKLKDENRNVYVPYPAKYVRCRNALGQLPGFTNLSEPITPLGVTLSDLTRMVMVDIPNIRDDNSLNCKNSTPKGMQEDP